MDFHAMVWIDACQIEADQYRVTISRDQLYSLLKSRAFIEVDRWEVLVFDWIVGRLKPSW